MSDEKGEQRYHISPETGCPSPCRATKRPCPVGGAHYPTLEAAQAAYEASRASSTLPEAVGRGRKSGSPSAAPEWTVYRDRGEATARPAPWEVYSSDAPPSPLAESDPVTHPEQVEEAVRDLEGHGQKLEALLKAGGRESWQSSRLLEEHHRAQCQQFKRLAESAATSFEELEPLYLKLREQSGLLLPQPQELEVFRTLVARADTPVEWAREAVSSPAYGWDEKKQLLWSPAAEGFTSEDFKKLLPPPNFRNDDRARTDARAATALWTAPQLPVEWAAEHTVHGVLSEGNLEVMHRYRGGWIPHSVRTEWTNPSALAGLLQREDCPQSVAELAYSARSRLHFTSLRETGSRRWAAHCEPVEHSDRPLIEAAAARHPQAREAALAGLGDTLEVFQQYSALIEQHETLADTKKHGEFGVPYREKSQEALHAATVEALESVFATVGARALRDWGSEQGGEVGRVAQRVAQLKEARQPLTVRALGLTGGLGRLFRGLGQDPQPPGVDLPEQDNPRASLPTY